VIVFDRARFGPVSRVERGGVPTAVTTLADGEDAHRWPHFLPTEAFLLHRRDRSLLPSAKPGTIKIGSLDQDEPAVAASGRFIGNYAPTVLFAPRPDVDGAGVRS
jgi:hypothetical protein